MVDAMRSSVPGRELATLGRGGVRSAMLEASASARRREAADLTRAAEPAAAARQRPRRASSRIRTHEIVASTI
jgi:hypothetical protein